MKKVFVGAAAVVAVALMLMGAFYVFVPVTGYDYAKIAPSTTLINGEYTVRVEQTGYQELVGKTNVCLQQNVFVGTSPVRTLTAKTKVLPLTQVTGSGSKICVEVDLGNKDDYALFTYGEKEKTAASYQTSSVQIAKSLKDYASTRNK